MSDFEFKSDFELDAEDRAEVERLAERTKAMNRREFITTSAGVLAFVLPAIATFTVPADALGGTGSGVVGKKKKKKKK